jgi:hypothetical protein
MEGGSLSASLAGYVADPRKAARLLAQVARAVHHAHQRGILHRDLKPANILLDREGLPHVTDFGLAKRIQGDSGWSQSSVIVGTPAYMSPEQATAQKSLTTATDVYGLGAVLYSLLTGGPPFQGANILDILKQVEEREPTPPRALNQRVDRDLETICLTCLAKDPARRYRSAEELAEDLERWLQGKPILKRPAGRWEKAVKWVRRNPVVAGLVAAVVVVLLAGTGFATHFAIDASQQADEARKNEAKAVRAKKDVEKVNVVLETTLARSLLRPLGLQQTTLDRLERRLVLQRGPLTDAEIEALWELAATPSERLGLRFVQEALRSPVTIRQLKNRAEQALHAAVRLDPTKRAQVEQLLFRRLQEPGLDEGRQADLALIAVGLGDLTPTTRARVAQALTQAMAKTTDPDALGALAKGLAAVAARLEPKEVVATLARAMAKTTDRYALGELGQGLAVVAAWLEPKQAARSCAWAAAILTQALGKAERGWGRGRNYWATSALVTALGALTRALAAAAAQLEPKEAAITLARALTKAFARDRPSPFGFPFYVLSEGLAAVVARLEPKDVAPVAAILTEALAQPTDPLTVRGLARGMAALAGRLEPKEAARAATTLGQAMAQPTDPDTLVYLAEGLAAVAARLEPKEAARARAQAAAVLTKALAQPISPIVGDLARGMVALAGRLEPKEAARLAASLAQAMAAQTTKYRSLHHLARGLELVAGRLEPKEAARVAATLAEALPKTIDRTAWYFARGLVAVAARLEPKEAVATLAQALTKTKSSTGQECLAQGLAAAAARLEPKEAVATLAQALAKRPHPVALGFLAEGLAVVAARLGPKQAARSCAQAATILTQAVAQTTDSGAVLFLAKGLAAMAPWLEPKDAGGAVATLAQAIARTDERFYQWNPGSAILVVQYLAAVAARMDAKEAVGTVAHALTRTKSRHARHLLAYGLAVVAARLEPKEAARSYAQAATILTQAVAQTTDSRALQRLTLSLAGVAGRLEPKEAGQAADTLAQAMAQTTDPSTLFYLAEGLAAVAARLEPKEAARSYAQAAATLCLALTRTSDQFDAEMLARRLAGVLTRADTRELSRRAAAVVAAVGCPAGCGHAVGTPALLRPALAPLPCRFSTPELVEFLKYPTCVGPARRVILDQLEQRHRRPFADHWAFVRFANEQKLDLDFTSPPQRPVLPATGEKK